MSVTKKQAEDFVHFGEESYSSLKIIKDMVSVYWGAAWLLWSPFSVAGRGLIFCIVITLLALLYNIAFCVLKSNLIKKTYRLRFLTNSISFSSMYLLFYLFIIFFINVSDASSTLWHDIELTICFVLFPSLNILFTLGAIKKDVYDRDKPKSKESNTVGYLVTGCLGIFIGRIVEPSLTQSQAISLIFVLVEILLLLISFASPNVLRLYFAYKYDIVADAEGETVSTALVYNTPKMSIAKRIIKLFTKILIVGFAIIMLYAMSQTV